LVSHVFTSSLLGVFLFVLLLFHWKTIVTIELLTFQLDMFFRRLRTTYFWCSVLTALFVCLLVGFLYYRYRYDHIKQVIHRQKLAKMVLENGWYETKQVTKESFFKDIPSDKTKDKISHFPKIYYRFTKGLLHIQVEITLGKYQEPLLNLEKKLESGLYCELVSKELHDSFVEYILLYDTIANRISIEEVIAQNGSLKRMESVYWE